MSLSPTALTLKRLRDDGWPLVEVVEHWNSHIGIRQDLFGFIDVLAVGPSGVLGVQTTSAGHVSDRSRKIREHPNLAAVLDANITVRVHGWKQPNGPRTRWVLHRDEEIT